MSKKAPQKSQRQARLAELQRQQKAAERRRMYAVVAVVVVVAGLIIGGTIFALNRSGGDGAVAAGTQTYTGLSRNHVPGHVDYPQDPPVGGDHNAIWQNCGFYDQEIANEHGVHSLEHGAVWITYSPDLPADQVALLKADAQNSDHVLVSPYPGLDSPVVATAWGVQLHLQSAADPKLTDFLRTYVQGSQTPEPGAACSGGTSDSGTHKDDHLG